MAQKVKVNVLKIKRHGKKPVRCSGIVLCSVDEQSDSNR